MYELDVPLRQCSACDLEDGEFIVFGSNKFGLVKKLTGTKPIVFSLTDLKGLNTLDDWNDPLEDFQSIESYGSTFRFRGTNACKIANHASSVPSGALVVRGSELLIAYAERGHSVRFFMLANGTSRSADSLQVSPLYFEHWSVVIPRVPGNREQTFDFGIV